MRRLAKLLQVKALQPYRLRVTFQGDEPTTVDIEARVTAVPGLESLRDATLWATARVAYWGSAVAWGPVLDQEDRSGPIDMAGELLWRLAGEQRGQLMSTEAFRRWREDAGLTQTAAAEALGLSRRMVQGYESGEHRVPRTVMLACRGWEKQGGSSDRPAA